MNAVLKSEVFVESKNMRDQYIDRTGVLNKVKKLVLLPDGEHMTVKMAAEFYDVEYKTVNQVLIRNKSEFALDGVRTITSKDKGFDKLSKALSVGQFIVKLLPRRAILRIGMLLKNSEVAAQVRTYLLKIEEKTKQEDKEMITGSWDDKEIVRLYRIIDRETGNGVNRMNAVRTAAAELNRNQRNVYAKLNRIENQYGSLEKYIIKNNITYINQESEEYHKADKIDNNKKEIQASIIERIGTLENKLTEINELKDKIREYEIQILEKDNQVNILTEKNQKLAKALKIEKEKLSAIQKILLSGRKSIKSENNNKVFTVDKYGIVQKL